MMRMIMKIVWSLAALAGLTAMVTAIWLFQAGISARSEPSPLEASVARRARAAMIPSAARARKNPVPSTDEDVMAGMEHWAYHCFTCHANDGSGGTDMGRGLYPRVPDMRLPATQQLTDGELFYIIENGVKLTGMPAWGTGTDEGEHSSWQLVSFIRKLPSLTDAEIAAMEDLNPQSPDEWRSHEEERRFLAGESEAAPAPAPSHKH